MKTTITMATPADVLAGTCQHVTNYDTFESYFSQCSQWGPSPERNAELADMTYMPTKVREGLAAFDGENSPIVGYPTIRWFENKGKIDVVVVAVPLAKPNRVVYLARWTSEGIVAPNEEGMRKITAAWQQRWSPVVSSLAWTNVLFWPVAVATMLVYGGTVVRPLNALGSIAAIVMLGTAIGCLSARWRNKYVIRGFLKSTREHQDFLWALW